MGVVISTQATLLLAAVARSRGRLTRGKAAKLLRGMAMQHDWQKEWRWNVRGRGKGRGGRTCAGSSAGAVISATRLCCDGPFTV